MRRRATDNTNPVLKAGLRRRFAALSDRKLCFDLFCGTGSFHDIYSEMFGQVVAVDRSADQLDQVVRRPNVRLIQGRCERVINRLIAQLGLPSFLDLDAYGNPDGPLLAARPALSRARRLAIVATDGTCCRRQSGRNTVPAVWGYGTARWSRGSLPLRDYPVLIREHLVEWFPELVVIKFECHKATQGVWYYGALLERREAMVQGADPDGPLR